MGKLSTIPIGVGAIALLTLSSCGPTADEQAAAHFDHANQHAEAMLNAQNYHIALTAYEPASDNVKRLLEEQSNTALAVSLSSGSTNIAGFTLDGFKALEQDLRQWAAAEQNLLVCSEALTKKVKEKADQDFNLIRLAEVYATMGDTNHTRYLLSQATESTKAETNLVSQAHAYIRMSEIYDLIGSKEEAKLTSEKALELVFTEEAQAEDDPFIKTIILSKAALRHLDEDDHQRGMELTQLAIQAETNYVGKSRFRPGLTRLASTYNDAGYFSIAIDILHLETPENHSLAYEISSMASTNRSPEELAQLTDLAMTFTDEYDRDRILSKISSQYAVRGHFSSASMLQSLIENSFCRDREAWHQAVCDHIHNQRINAAFMTVDLMQNNEDITRGLLEIATSLNTLGYKDFSDSMMISALDYAQGGFMPDYELIGEVAVAYANQGYTNQSNELLTHHSAVAQAEERTWSKANALNDLASAYLELDRNNEAIALLTEARETISKRKDEDNGLLLKHIAENYCRAECYHLAYETVDSIPEDSDYREDGFQYLAEFFVKVHEHKLARDALEHVTTDYTRSLLIDDMIEAYIALGQIEYALEMTKFLREDFEVSGVLGEVAIYQATNDALHMAFDTLGLFTNTSSRISTMINIAEETAPMPPLNQEERDALTTLVLDTYPLCDFWNNHGLER